MTIKNIFKQYQISTGGQYCPELGTTDLDDVGHRICIGIKRSTEKIMTYVIFYVQILVSSL